LRRRNFSANRNLNGNAIAARGAGVEEGVDIGVVGGGGFGGFFEEHGEYFEGWVEA
jgi:hypothetical protein